MTLIEMMLYSIPLSFVIAATPSIPGGPPLMVAMLAQAYFGITELQAGLIISIHVIQLSSCVGCNTCSDGALALIIEKLEKIFFKK